MTTGTAMQDDLTQTFTFSETYQLIGFKSLAESESLESLGLIVFDTTCNLLDPTGATTTPTIPEVPQEVAPSLVEEDFWQEN